MKRVVLAIVSTVASLVLLLSFKTHSTSALTTPPAAVASTGTSSTGTSSTGTSSTGTSSSPTKTYTGTAADTRYGPVQVRITVKSGKVTNVVAISYPTSDPRDAQINAYAIPALNSEATSAGSANISMISGATYTSEGYVRSLQSALNEAGL